MSSRRPPGYEPLRLETFRHLFASVCEEMGATLERSAFSVNVRERRDYSCALFDAEGRLVGQAAHLPVHLGSAPESVRAAMARHTLAPGDAVLLNDPYAGGTHLPDLTLVAPVYLKGDRRPSFYVANRAHHADVGGPEPGSMGPAREIYGEGLRLPPVKLVREGVVERDLLALFLANARSPAEREGDLFAQWAALRLGAGRVAQLAQEFGGGVLVQRARDQLHWAAELVRAELAKLAAGDYEAEDTLDVGGPAVRARLTLRSGRLVVDFGASDDQVPQPLNCPRAVTVSALLYVLRLLLPADAPTNEGLLAPVTLITRPGSLVDARAPAAVAAGNVETSQRVVDVLLAALAAASPGRLPAASAGTMSNLTLGVAGPAGEPHTYYETLPGGAGGGPSRVGADALQTHMTNTRNTPIEAFEREFPVRVVRLALRAGSGGPGARPGGCGLEKDLLFLRPARVGWLATRQFAGPPGLEGGLPGRPGSARWSLGRKPDRGGAGRAPSSGDLSRSKAADLPAGALLRLRTPGGGGHGAADNSLVRPRP